VTTTLTTDLTLWHQVNAAQTEVSFSLQYVSRTGVGRWIGFGIRAPGATGMVGSLVALARVGDGVASQYSISAKNTAGFTQVPTASWAV
jgi:hypothetical protein